MLFRVKVENNFRSFSIPSVLNNVQALMHYILSLQFKNKCVVTGILVHSCSSRG